jgi:hypothetical protein
VGGEMNLELDFRPLRTRAFKPGSQAFRILEHMLSGKSITPLQAAKLFNCYALHSRISEIRESGWNVKKQMVDGHGEYSL